MHQVAAKQEREEDGRLRPLLACFAIAANLMLVGLFFASGEYVVMLEGGIAPASVQLPRSFEPEASKQLVLNYSEREAIVSHRARPPRTR